MIQQYDLLRKDNDLLNSLIGQSFNQKSKFEAEKILDEIHSKAAGRTIGKKTLCYIVDKQEIKGVGGSTLMKDKKTGKITSNLILDNFGIWLSRVWKGGVITISAALITTAGSAKSVNVYTSGSQFNSANAFRGLLQVGSGNTAPARTDIAIETAFGSGPEATFFESSIPVYNLGNSNFKNLGQITALGSGTVNESVFLVAWRATDLSTQIYALYRDIISPGQAFITGQSIALEYTTQM